MKVYIVYQGWQNDTECVIGVYLDDKKADKRVVKEEKDHKDEGHIYFYSEEFEVIE